MEPEFVDGDGTFVFELVGPFSTVFILDIFPFRAHASLEEVVVGFEGKVVCFSNVVLSENSIYKQNAQVRTRIPDLIYWDIRKHPKTPRPNQRWQLLSKDRSSCFPPGFDTNGQWKSRNGRHFLEVGKQKTFPDGGLVNHKVHVFINGCFTLKLSAEWKTVNCSLLPESMRVSVEPSTSPFGGETGSSLSGRCSSRTRALVSWVSASMIISADWGEWKNWKLKDAIEGYMLLPGWLFLEALQCW